MRMKANTILVTLILLSTAVRAQYSQQVAKIYDENKYRQVVDIAGRLNAYVPKEDEKVIDDLAGRSYYGLQMYDSAVYFENKALSLDNDESSTSGWAYAYRGMALCRLGKKEEGIADLHKAINLNKTHNSVEVAKEFLDEASAATIPDAKYEFYFSQGEYKAAIDEGRKQLLKQEYKSVMELVGAAYYNIRRYDSAIYFERRAIAADNDATLISGWGHVYLGMALYQKNEKDKAIEELRKAISLDKTSNSVRKAENFLDAILNGRRIVIDSVHQAIKDQLIGGSNRAAAGMALRVLAANPGDALGWNQLAIAYCWLHNYDSSLYCGQKTLETDKEQTVISCDVHYYMGIDRFMKNDREGADNEFTAAINERTSDNTKKRVARARLLMGLDDIYNHWKTVETDDIIFHFQNKKSIEDVDALMGKYEKEYTNARGVLPSPPLPKKIDLFVWEREGFVRSGLQNSKDAAYTDDEFCLAHVVRDNNPGAQIMHILGHWQKKQ